MHVILNGRETDKLEGVRAALEAETGSPVQACAADLTNAEDRARLAMQMKGITYEESRKAITDSIAAKRFGQPDEFGDAYAFLCSAQAGFISGQNIQMDGGSYKDLL